MSLLLTLLIGTSQAGPTGEGDVRAVLVDDSGLGITILSPMDVPGGSVISPGIPFRVVRVDYELQVFDERSGALRTVGAESVWGAPRTPDTEVPLLIPTLDPGRYRITADVALSGRGDGASVVRHSTKDFDVPRPDGTTVRRVGGLGAVASRKLVISGYEVEGVIVSDGQRHELEAFLSTYLSVDLVQISIEGFACPLGPDDINLTVSQQRADWIRNLILARRPEIAGLVTSVGLGETHLLATNLDSYGMNRRVEVTVSYLPPP